MYRYIKSLLFAVLLFVLPSCGVQKKVQANADLVLGNRYISRIFSVTEGYLKTAEINNKLAHTIIKPLDCPGFSLRISQGTHITGTDVILTGKDFVFVDSNEYKLPNGKGICFNLKNQKYDLKVAVHYELKDDDAFMRKYLKISSGKAITLERINVDVIAADSEQPYKLKQITARGRGQWKPGLGQPLFTTQTATFWGIEFPAAYNFVRDNTMYCGYLWGREIQKNTIYTSYKAVVGVSDSYEFISDAFYDYINSIRIRPLRLRIQYNSWFDYGKGVTETKFINSVNKIYQELVVKRGVKPFAACVIDDGWQDVHNWKDSVWPVNSKFDRDFAASFKAVKAVKSELGLWLSPQCNFGAKKAVIDMRKNGLEALEICMSLAGPKYMSLLKKRMVELTKMGVSYFKLDGCFGHLNTREFDIYGKEHGLPYMPQLGLDGLNAHSEQLNSSKYDELKIYYLSAGTEKLMDIFLEMNKANPDVYIVISNGAWLSPWWLMYCDTVWMINAGDAAGGGRTKELIYRDGIYYQIWKQENTQYPMNSIFNHEPKKCKTGESKDVFRDYLYMNVSRGTGFIELYLKTFKLADRDWDVLSEGLHWAQRIFPAFIHAKMHGGDPRKGQVYGFTGWTGKMGYVSIHNPGNQTQTYSFTLNRKFGLVKNSGPFVLSSPLKRYSKGLKDHYSYGDTITVTLAPGGVIILNFDYR